MFESLIFNTNAVSQELEAKESSKQYRNFISIYKTANDETVPGYQSQEHIPKKFTPLNAEIK